MRRALLCVLLSILAVTAFAQTGSENRSFLPRADVCLRGPGGRVAAARVGRTATDRGEHLVAAAADWQSFEVVEVGAGNFDCGTNIPSAAALYVGFGTGRTSITIDRPVADLLDLADRCQQLTIVGNDGVLECGAGTIGVNGDGSAIKNLNASELTAGTLPAGRFPVVNSNVGSFGSATKAGTFTVDATGRLTAAGEVTVTPSFTSLTATPSTLSGYGITDAVDLASDQTITGTKTFDDQLLVLGAENETLTIQFNKITSQAGRFHIGGGSDDGLYISASPSVSSNNYAIYVEDTDAVHFSDDVEIEASGHLILSNLTADRVLLTDASKFAASSTVTGTELEEFFAGQSGTFSPQFAKVGIGQAAGAHPIDITGSDPLGLQIRLANTAADDTLKAFGIVGRHYDTAEEDIAVLFGISDNTDTTFLWGGGDVAFNTPTVQSFFCGATTTTVTGTLVFELTSQGADAPLKITSPLHNYSSSTELTIASGVVTRTRSVHRIDTESNAASDDLHTINGGQIGDVLILTAENTNRTVVFKDDTGNLQLAGDCTLDNSQDTLSLLCVATGWLELARSNNGA